MLESAQLATTAKEKHLPQRQQTLQHNLELFALLATTALLVQAILYLVLLVLTML